MSIPNTVEQEIIIRAPRTQVYAAIADPAKVVRWFPDSMEGDYTAGHQATFDFGEYGKVSIYVEAAQPESYFAYRWVSGSHFAPSGYVGDVLTHPHTLVEFHLEEIAEGTRVKLVESGFASLPELYRAKNHEDNTGGWSYMLARLKTMAEA